MSDSACFAIPLVLGDAAVDSGSSSTWNTLRRFSICSLVSSAWWRNIFLTSAELAACSSSPSAARESSSIVIATRSWKRSRSAGDSSVV
ncbi:MAG: hypothetical protein K0Q52_3953 [Microbacterium sp.]|nr:hypothetical protein [Microbacterium sp.]